MKTRQEKIDRNSRYVILAILIVSFGTFLFQKNSSESETTPVSQESQVKKPESKESSEETYTVKFSIKPSFSQEQEPETSN